MRRVHYESFPASLTMANRSSDRKPIRETAVCGLAAI